MDLSDKYSKFQRIKQEEASIDFNDQQFDETKSSSHYSQIQVEKGFLSNRFLKSMSSHCATVLITLLIVIGKIIRFKISQNTNVQLFTVFILSVELSTRSKLEDKLSKMNELLFLQDEVDMKSEDSNPVVKQLIDKETFVSSHKLEGLKPTTSTYKTSTTRRISSTTSSSTTTPATTSIPNKIMTTTMKGVEEKYHHSCCSTIELSSKEETTYKMHPNVLGTYHLSSDGDKIFYKKLNKNIFLSRPSTHGKAYTWGVNSNPDKTWGWVRAVTNASCPTNIDKWVVFDKTKNRWTEDRTLNIVCL